MSWPDSDSDSDLGLYYRPPLDTAALRLLATELTGGAVEVTEPGGRGPWVDGGGRLTVEGIHIDWIYRDLDQLAPDLAAVPGRALRGRHPGRPPARGLLARLRR